MEYTIKTLAQMAGISSRTLRYYDEIGLLKPSRINSSGYRIYGQREVDLLQQILFYKSIEMKLEEIQHIISHPNFDINKSLMEHHQRLIDKRNELDKLILTVEKTLAYNKGEIIMSDKEKFQGFKKEKLAENEEMYGNEIREKYGRETVEASNKKFMNMSEGDFENMKEIENQMFKSLSEVVKTSDLDSQAAKDVYEKHKAWLSFSWENYSKEAHIGLAEMYVADERFAKYYNDRLELEVVTVLRDIIVKYAK
ncbi:MerR family transcriptional regulator [Clostridium cylindrosporum]|uniref:HTH-type transcriptional activator Mta n=1 Tax=Clostridium cylindrosporum DSM 605 TaxID=1121307 RepID=A0A0J8DCI9_CLOCY|nr:MerR family transcriptional regulator [Clostridium cylindrosporum]KMT21973.1 HTH-type transcriptional activator Mta [Clostridium cylindrosporum DSM 605]